MNSEDIKVNINKLSFYFNIAIIGAIFSVFCLIHDTTFIYYGFITFAYGVVAQISDIVFSNIFPEKKIKELIVYFIFQFILVVFWLIISFLIYKQF